LREITGPERKKKGKGNEAEFVFSFFFLRNDPIRVGLAICDLAISRSNRTYL
jgi:hypothetical protein